MDGQVRQDIKSASPSLRLRESSNRLDRVIIEQVNPHTKLQARRAHNFRATPGVAYLRVMHLREQVDNQPTRLRLIIETEIRPHARIHTTHAHTIRERIKYEENAERNVRNARELLAVIVLVRCRLYYDSLTLQLAEGKNSRNETRITIARTSEILTNV